MKPSITRMTQDDIRKQIERDEKNVRGDLDDFHYDLKCLEKLESILKEMEEKGIKEINMLG